VIKRFTDKFVSFCNCLFAKMVSLEVTVMTKVEPRHPFAELLRQYRTRKPGLTQTRLAELAGYDQAILVRMGKGKKDLTGPSGRERVVRLIGTLADQSVLTTVDEANALLLAANMSPLFERQVEESLLITRLARSQPRQRVRRTNLPAPLTSLIGRAQEIADVRHLLTMTRLLTLTGAGGCGKTRLAQRVAADALIHYSEGVWYAELAALTDPVSIAEAVVRLFDLQIGDQSPQEAVADYLYERQVLLVLDNCEHLIEPVAAFAVAILQACPRVSILATSREALNVEGETAWRVPSMELSEAGRLFVERAAAARSGSSLSKSDDTVLHICRRLDGIPLAIELAAARTQALSLTEIATRLDDRFNLLSGARRGVLLRHQTLRALIDWSYDSLSELEQTVFRRLAVFVGGWTLNAAIGVAGDGLMPGFSTKSGEPMDVDSYSESHPAHFLQQTEVITILTQLVGKSLIAVEEHDGETRYTFLETVRQYAWEKLVLHGELRQIHHQHAIAFAHFAEEAEPHVRGAHQRQWGIRIQHDYANLLAALTWSFGVDGNLEVGCRLVGATIYFWAIASDYERDAPAWVLRAWRVLDQDPSLPSCVRGRVLIAVLTYRFMATAQEARDLGAHARSCFRMCGDEFGLAIATTLLGNYLADIDPQDSEGAQFLEEATQIANMLGDLWAIGLTHLYWAWHMAELGDFKRAEALIQIFVASNKKCGNLSDLTSGLFDLSDLWLQQLQFEKALDYASQAYTLAHDMHHTINEVRALVWMAECHRHLRDVPRAISLSQEAFNIAREKLVVSMIRLPARTLAKALNDAGEVTRARELVFAELQDHRYNHHIQHRRSESLFDVLACIECHCGEYERCARLSGCADAELGLIKKKRFPYSEWDYEPHFSKAREMLGEAAYEAARAQGRIMTPAQATEYALQR